MSLLQKIIHNLFVRESGLKRYFLNTSWLLMARVVQMLVSLVVGGMVARYLGPENYGTYNYVISFVGLFAALSTLGISSVVVRICFPVQPRLQLPWVLDFFSKSLVVS